MDTKQIQTQLDAKIAEQEREYQSNGGHGKGVACPPTSACDLCYHEYLEITGMTGEAGGGKGMACRPCYEMCY